MKSGLLKQPKKHTQLRPKISYWELYDSLNRQQSNCHLKSLVQTPLNLPDSPWEIRRQDQARSGPILTRPTSSGPTTSLAATAAGSRTRPPHFFSPFFDPFFGSVRAVSFPVSTPPNRNRAWTVSASATRSSFSVCALETYLQEISGL